MSEEQEKRIIEYTEETEARSDDYYLMDSTTYGTRKIKAKNIVNIGSVDNIFTLRANDGEGASGVADVLNRSSVVKCGNIIIMSAVIELKDDISQGQAILTFKTPSTNYGSIKPFYNFDLLALYGSNDIKSLKYDTTQEAFVFPYGALTITSGSVLRFQTQWVVE